MIFSTLVFLCLFLPVVLLLHTLLLRFRNTFPANFFLVLASLLFYSWGNPGHTWLLLTSGLLNYIFGILLERKKSGGLLAIGLFINLLMLGIYKYAGMLANGFVFLGGEITPDWNFIQNIALPLGISFYTFQGISYIIDVYRRDVTATRSWVDFFCYLMLFPQLVAGPIVRYSEVSQNVKSRACTLDGFESGAKRFICGLAKKCLLADSFARVADAAFAVPVGELSLAGSWIGGFCYAFQIYFDFSGYSDMAIGMGRMMGFKFPENFNQPYQADSIRDFWRRWHMTLSQWLRDYVYIPLGGSRRGTGRTYLNIFIVFFLCGLWHGASVNFIVWGVYYAVFLVAERLLSGKFPPMPAIVRHAYALLVILLGWIVFRADDLPYALAYYKAMLGLSSGSLDQGQNLEILIWLHGYWPVLVAIAAIVLCLPVTGKIAAKFQKAQNGFFTAFKNALWLGLLILCIMHIFSATHQYFIYFRF